ncbi:hypothetical protein PENTCL1PPCAC_2995 [Pristionchus entomophagus]|uniref:Secreted protein n=1 Tax=Pristionchus entomophagus TaxID=358040 RepID=A0AAV5SL08_9BILA|nr:hypothetical protein PENTCL1PPCAC_2995 [Pristionchus entomophagus]
MATTVSYCSSQRKSFCFFLSFASLLAPGPPAGPGPVGPEPDGEDVCGGVNQIILFDEVAGIEGIILESLVNHEFLLFGRHRLGREQRGTRVGEGVLVGCLVPTLRDYFISLEGQGHMCLLLRQISTMTLLMATPDVIRLKYHLIYPQKTFNRAKIDIASCFTNSVPLSRRCRFARIDAE